MKFKSWKEVSTLKPYLWPYKSSYISGFFCLFVSVFFTLLIPQIIKEAVDSIKMGAIHPQGLFFYAGLILGCALMQGVFKFLMRNILIGASRRIEYNIRNDFFSHIQGLSLSFFHQKRTGDTMSRATNDLTAVRSLLGPGIMYFANALILFLLDFVFMFAINWQLTLYILIPLPFFSYLIMLLSQKLHFRFKAVQEQFSVLNTQVQENFSGIRVVKAYVREEEMKHHFQKANDQYLQDNMKLVKIWGLFHPLTSFSGGFFLLLILWVGGEKVMANSMTIGGLVAFIGYVGILLWPAITLGWVINLFQRGAASMGRINEIFQVKPEIKDPAEPKVLPSLKGKIDFKAVNFSYSPEGPEVLKNISLTINPGETIGLVGRTGAGKSTLVNLIPRLYDVTGGEIKIDGVPIGQLSLKQLRQSIGYVPQETFIFSESIKHNIGLGLTEGPLEQVIEAACFSHLLEDIEEFPEKFDTVVGERGVTLSGGQKQRLAISRALIRKPPILIFDDVFSSVDLRTEKAIFEKLLPLRQGRTCIIIAHRLSTVRDCHRIYVLDQGKIAESGCHQELLAQKGIYATMYQKQLIIEEM